MANATTPLKAIRLNCLACCCQQPVEVKLCVIPDCPLYPFRLGKNPNRKGIGGRDMSKVRNIKKSPVEPTILGQSGQVE